MGKLQPGNELSLLEYQSADVDQFLRCEHGAEVALSEEETVLLGAALVSREGEHDNFY